MCLNVESLVSPAGKNRGLPLRQSRFKWKATSFLLNPLISVGSSLFGTLTRRSFERNEWSAVLRGNL